ncbi:MAG: hypothetical protein ACOYI6_04030 [Christensenellales bacterium]
MNANTNTAASFTLDTLSINGQTFPAQYSVTPTGTVYAFVTVQEDGQPVNLRVKIEPNEAAYAAALAAARQEKAQREPAQEASAPAAKPKAQRKPKAPKAATVSAADPAQEPAPVAQAEPAQEPAPVAQPEPVQDVQEEPAQTEPAADPQPEPAQHAPAAAPGKPFAGTQLTGTGWRILFDQEHNRTRVILDQDTAPAAAREAVEQAGFYWSAVLGSWNKKLTHKAHRAAQALALQLQALGA